MVYQNTLVYPNKTITGGVQIKRTLKLDGYRHLSFIGDGFGALGCCGIPVKYAF